MKKQLGFYIFMLMGCTFITSCSNDDKPTGAATTITKKPVVMDPFRYHKLVEVSPGQDYDILSWGRGSSTIGSFEILHSDSAGAKYTTTTGDLDGSIVDVYNSDMDLDGNPEIIIQAKGKDTLNYTNMYAFEFSNGKAQKLDFPRLNQKQRQGYRGEDNFYIKDGALMREFPIYNGSGKDAKPSGQKRLLQYGLRDNGFTVKQLSTDSTSTKAGQGTAKGNATPAAVTPKTSEAVKKAKKAATETKHKKKHKKHHHTSDADAETNNDGE
ncbi:PliI family lysozyme inhibitor of I-type lysozyme [Mucilaginibacter sp. X4EP1]|uniref:PliI family lysozyme inhibitor of I-type lysozyme n=1 Tax=Mucilaginibacter sp. X4EP1 TaxID=2723092 RepID=UPI00216A084F|nr:PliI family lysozyme inhibitor of I-type lysozyme [Mucilaginibacter sp. X4EP1]MCS3813480.1 hypothetical protein [Mucilaginibacter sp. X4EP1]